MFSDLLRLRMLWRIVSTVCTLLVGLALMGIIPGAHNIDGWFARFFGPVLLLIAAVKLIQLIRHARRDASH